MAQSTALQPWQAVKFAEPQTADEESERFVVVELRGDRVLVESDCGVPIRPQFVYSCAELTAA
jgi:hypothetical protein